MTNTAGQRHDHDEFTQSMLDAGEEIKRKRRADRSKWWLQVVALASMVWVLLLFAGTARWMIAGGIWSTAPLLPFWSPELYGYAYDLVATHASPVHIGSCALTALGINFTILRLLYSDAVAGEDAHRTRTVLRAAVFAMTLVAAMTAITGWATIGSKHDVWPIAFTCGVALLAAAVGILAVLRLNVLGYDRSLALLEVSSTRAQLTDWQAALDDRDVPSPLDLPAAGQEPRIDAAVAKQLGRRCSVALAQRLLLLGMLSALYPWSVLSVFISATDAGTQQITFYWWIGAAAGMCLAAAGLSGMLAAIESRSRWTGYEVTSPQRRLVLRPAIVYTWYGLFYVAILTSMLLTYGAATTFILGSPFAGAAVVWAILWASRRWPQASWLKVATWPLWGQVQLDLRAAQDTTENKWNELQEEERADRAVRRPPNPRIKQPVAAPVRLRKQAKGRYSPR
ncbi:MAG: hypothetical protein K0U84_08850 [Actinomycetia bacterium]|nr:hypothetical protein [Actinomycetes bacterium]